MDVAGPVHLQTNMKEVKGDLWKLGEGYWVCVPTNGDLKVDGSLVMGKGVALDAATRFPSLAKKAGDFVSKYGNEPCMFEYCQVITIPTKFHWYEDADLELIKKSLQQVQGFTFTEKAFLPRIGCGLGKLSWDVVGPLCHSILDDRFTVVCL